MAIYHPIFEQPETEKAEWQEESIRRGEEICTFFNRRPINENGYKILFIENSQTCHLMGEGVWSSIHGMAASAHEKDYLHIFVQHLRKKMPDRSIEVFLETGAGVGLAIDRIEGGEHENREYDLAVVQRGEDDKVFDDEFTEARANFKNRCDEKSSASLRSEAIAGSKLSTVSIGRRIKSAIRTILKGNRTQRVRCLY